MASTPKWAETIAHEIAPNAELHWRKSSTNKYSSGHCYYKKYITVTAGTNRVDQKLVLLHELAHWIIGAEKVNGRIHHHSPEFWDKAFELFRAYKAPMRYACKRETEYRKGAMKAYHRNRKIQ